jgi:putative selenium metabolism hydrolase
MPSFPAPIAQEALFAFAQKLVATPSPSGGEGEAARLVAEEMQRVGFQEVHIDRLGNVVGRIGGGSGKKLLYDAHLDTVDAGDPAAWSYPPLAGHVEQGVLYGLGAVDTKGALAAMVYAGKALAEGGPALAGDLYLVAVVQEEPCEGAALRQFMQAEGWRPDGVLIGEPTDLQVARGQRGRIEFRVTLSGKACHAAAPERGVNAIYAATRAIVGLELLAPQLNSDPFLGKGTLAVTEIASRASSRNAVPDSCTFYVDRRLTIGETEAKATAELRRALSREGATATVEVTDFSAPSYTGARLEARQACPYWVTSEKEPLLAALVSTIESALGFVPRLGRWEFSTDGVYTAGEAGLPTVGFGPGEERFAHTCEEQIRLKDIASAARVYAELAARFLVR